MENGGKGGGQREEHKHTHTKNTHKTQTHTRACLPSFLLAPVKSIRCVRGGDTADHNVGRLPKENHWVKITVVLSIYKHVLKYMEREGDAHAHESSIIYIYIYIRRTADGRHEAAATE